MSDTLVMKFGGTSVGGPDAIRRLTDVVGAARADWPRLAIVVSAMSGVTDSLLAAAQAAVNGDAARPPAIAAQLRQRHLTALQQLAPESTAVAGLIQAQMDELESLCHAIGVLGEATPRALDAIASLGEKMSAPLVAEALSRAGVAARAVDASELIVTDATHQAAVPDMDATRGRAQARLEPLLAAGVVPVITGFTGATLAGVVTTLGRGGSDFSAAIIGVAVDASEVWIWTDVDGVMTADPRVAAEARTLPQLTFREVSELAFFGARVLHPKTIRPVIERGITLRVKNTFNPSQAGTRIVPDNGADARPGSGVVNAVTAFKGQCVITLEGRGMIGIPGIAARTFGAVAHTRTSVAMISQASSEQSICFVVPFASAEAVRRGLADEFRHELARQDIDSVTASSESAVVTVVGAGMRHTPGIAGKIFTALGAAGVNVVAIAQGSSECSISLVVAAAQADQAVRAVHQLIVETRR